MKAPRISFFFKGLEKEQYVDCDGISFCLDDA